VFVAQAMRFAHGGDDALVVVAQLSQHVLRLDVIGVVVGQPLLARYVADRAQRVTADLAHPFGDHVGGGEDLVGLFVEQQMIVAEMRPADVPVEVLGLEIEREAVRQDGVERTGNVLTGVGAQIGRRLQARRAVVSRSGFAGAHGNSPRWR